MPTFNEKQYNELKHYGIKRRSGRYPWGTGGEDSASGASTRAKAMFEMVDELKAQGLTQKQIAEGLGFESTTELRQAVTIGRNAIRNADQDKAVKLRDKGWSVSAIGRAFDPPKNESSVRDLLNPTIQARTKVLDNTADMLRQEFEGGGFLDIGAGREYYVGNGISKEQLASAVAVLKDEGYVVFNKVQVPQAGGGPNQKTTVKVLAPPGTQYRDVMTNLDKIKGVTKVTEDGGETFDPVFLPPLQISSKRVAVRYDEDGGSTADGVIYVRPGVKDIELGGSRYAQVRIDVEGTHYLKGMAMYKDDLPPGVDLMFNTNKSRAKIGTNKLDAMKPQEDDKDNPFGAVVRRQITETGPDGKKRVTSAMNILNEEGGWDRWSKTLSSQVLSKQSTVLAEQQLRTTYERRKKEFDEIMALTNPTVKAHLLDKFAETVDSSAVHLEAAGLPRSSYHAILPFNSLKDNEVYAPNYKNGEQLALIRYPHGGTFEIPVLTVNNNAPAPKAAIGRALDAVGINSRVAERLSGADFDGDFVMIIPNDSQVIKSSPPLKRLENFNPKQYKLPDDAPRMSAKTKGKQMGDVSNLITDMTIMGAPRDEIARAVAHSMVVIDAEKHHLDYKKSAIDHGIGALKLKYQARPDGTAGGAATLISRATSEQRVNKRRDRRASDGGAIDKATGKRMYEETGETRTVTKVMKRTGEIRVTEVPVTTKSTKLGETDDARTLLSGPNNTGTRMERVYADHSNRLKALANESRREMVSLSGIPYSPSAKKVYEREVAELDARLKLALMNSPRERQAQLLANAIIASKKAANPGMDDARLKKVKAQALVEARQRAGASKELVELEQRHWDAIQAGAISPNKLTKILQNTDIETIKTLATPRPDIKMSPSNLTKARAMAARGATQAEIAGALGVSVTTLKRGLADG